MQLEKTNRGFGILNFVDRYGVECSLQKSSLATEDAIWFGVDDANPQVLIEGKGWQRAVTPPGVHYTTRMHLTQDMVRELLPLLQKFADTGELE